jgi:hypothetical protein
VSKSIVGSSQHFLAKPYIWQYSRAGARCRTSTHSLKYNCPSIACVTLSQPMSIDVGGNLMSDKYLGLGFDSVINFCVGDLSFRTASSREVILLGCMEPEMRSWTSATKLRWRFSNLPQYKSMTSITRSVAVFNVSTLISSARSEVEVNGTRRSFGVPSMIEENGQGKQP